MLIYLDSSLIVKRYIDEQGTEFADYLFDQAAKGHLTIVFNLLNIGEVLGVFDKYFQRNLITRDILNEIKDKFIDETLRLLRINRLSILPTTNTQQMIGWGLIMAERLYIVDAIQITSFTEVNASLFVSGDKYLVNVAKKLGINAFTHFEFTKIQKELKKSENF